MNKYPDKITIVESAYCLDGGSTMLDGYDQDGNTVSIYLDWSIPSGESRNYQLFFNSAVVSKRSDEEERVLGLLENALYEFKEREYKEPVDDASEINPPPGGRLILGDDIQRVMDGIESGPEDGLKAMVNEVISRVRSDQYLNPMKAKSISEIIEDGEQAFRRKEWDEVIKILDHDVIRTFLSDVQKKKLEIAKAKSNEER